MLHGVLLSAGFLLFSLVALMLTGEYRLVAALRRDHPAIWERLGRPSPWFYRFEDVGMVHSFLFSREFETTADIPLIRLAERLRRLRMAAYVASGLLISAALAQKILR